MGKKAKNPPVDGLGPDDLRRIHKALGQVRKWSYPVRLAKKRAMGADGFPRCENKKCPSRGKPVPGVQADHINPIGEIGGPRYIQKMFIPSSQLMCLCLPCHREKTKAERSVKKLDSKKKGKDFTDEF